MIAVIDYGMGNLCSVQKGFEKVGHNAVIVQKPEELTKASAIVLPGVGAFRDCMNNLKTQGLVDALKKEIASGKPFLGICLGLHLLFTESEEFGIHKGLDIIKGRVRRLPCEEKQLKIPHMGWNSITPKKDSPLLKGVPPESYLYFVHSYYVDPCCKEVVSTMTDYGIEFTSSIEKDNIFAVQFHPEKSQSTGLTILKNFGDIS